MPTSPVPIAFPPTWLGETCKDDPAPPTEAYFHVPRGSNDGDFYRLPFPNDVRASAPGMASNRISLSNPNHPTPGSALLGYDLVQRYITDLENTADGFSTYPTVYFRFNATVAINSAGDGNADGSLKAKGAVQFVDITNPAKPQQLGFYWSATTDRNAYICNNWMAVRLPENAQPLTPGHTYAVILAKGLLDANGQEVVASDDLTALLGSTAPTDAALAPQYAKYAPLRAYVAAQNVAAVADGGSGGLQVLNAAVFTVGHPNAIGPKIAAAVAATAIPTASSWTLCNGTNMSPCPQATGDRACPTTPNPAFDELHALVKLPIFQSGMAPYTTYNGPVGQDAGTASPLDGDFQFDATGNIVPQGTAEVCMSITVPKGNMPTGGWPILLYAHGTGGSFRSHVNEGVSARLASVDVAGGGTMNAAVLGIDQVETGTRRGSSTDSEDNLFFDFANPGAARGNPLQGAADQISLLRFIASVNLPKANSPTGAALQFGPVAFWGHSQGATEGGIAMPYVAGAPTGVLGALLSGEGASLKDALVSKTNPVNIAAALPVALQDPKVDVNHPVLALLQNDLDLVDPLNHAGAFFQSPVAANVKHVFQPFGQGDTYAPPITQEIFAIAAGLGEEAAPTGVTDNPEWVKTPLGVSSAGGNVTVMGLPGKMFTAIVRQYAPGSGYDGHFVSFDNTQAEADVNHFLADALAGKVPMVGR
jgi:hypothetical protein